MLCDGDSGLGDRFVLGRCCCAIWKRASAVLSVRCAALCCRKYRAAVKEGSDDEAGPSSAPAESKLPPPPAGGPPPIKEEDSVTRERHIGKGTLACPDIAGSSKLT